MLLAPTAIGASDRLAARPPSRCPCCPCPPLLQKQVAGALDAIQGVLTELAERVAEQGLEADVSACGRTRGRGGRGQGMRQGMRRGGEGDCRRHAVAPASPCLHWPPPPPPSPPPAAAGRRPRKGAELPSHQGRRPAGAHDCQPTQGECRTVCGCCLFIRAGWWRTRRCPAGGAQLSPPDLHDRIPPPLPNSGACAPGRAAHRRDPAGH